MSGVYNEHYFAAQRNSGLLAEAYVQGQVTRAQVERRLGDELIAHLDEQIEAAEAAKENEGIGTL